VGAEGFVFMYFHLESGGMSVLLWFMVFYLFLEGVGRVFLGYLELVAINKILHFFRVLFQG